ncbi:putative dynamin GTPase [Hypoxylon sp. FL0543]|nr:putative dynamin GTPase [Hypoxylon sp. FL0543]
MTLNKGEAPAGGLSSARTKQLLKQISKVQANGVNDAVSMPQLVVCGGRSSGKSSVLERLTGVPFPQGQGPCTRFPIEIVFRHTDAPQQITARIDQHDEQSPEILRDLGEFHRKLSGLSEIPTIVEEAAFLMRISGHGTPEATNAFSCNVLKFEVTGSTGLDLTIVDFPGFIPGLDEWQIEGDERTEDDKNIQSLLEEYLSVESTIILAVLQTPEYSASQNILRLAREYDPKCRRTVAVLTKTDLVTSGAGHVIGMPIKSTDVKEPEVRFFLKNPSPLKKADEAPSAQSESEIEFFSRSAWKEHVDERRLGIENLKQFLQELLEEHIERQMPKLWSKTKEKLTEIEGELTLLGSERPTAGQVRPFLTEVSMRFYQLAKDACDGNYRGTTAEFFSDPKNRVRLVVHLANTVFSDFMRENGEKRKVISSSATEQGQCTDSADDSDPTEVGVTTEGMMEWVLDVYSKSRGRELPGTHNHVFLAELFHEQSSRWPHIAKGLAQKVDKMMSEWVTEAVSFIISDEQLRRKVLILCRKGLEENRRLAYEELQKLVDDEMKQQPITYNHYYTQKIERTRDEASQDLVRPVIANAVERGWTASKFISPQMSDQIEEAANELKSRLSIDTVHQACNEGLAALDAYYAVALKRFVDNVCRQVIERHFIARLPNIFCPQTIAKLSDEELLQIGSESRKQRNRRAHLTATAQNLRESLVELEMSSV